MNNLQFNPYQCGAGMGQGGLSLKSLNPLPRPIPSPFPLQGGENPRVAK